MIDFPKQPNPPHFHICYCTPSPLLLIKTFF